MVGYTMVSKDRMNALLNRSLLLVTSLCCSLGLVQSHAAPLAFGSDNRDWYQVEFVLFEQLEGARTELRFEANKYVPLQTNDYQYYFEKPYFNEGYPLLPDRHFSAIATEASELSGSAKRLNRDRRTGLLTFAAWQQPIDNDSATLPLKLSMQLSGGRQLEGYVRIRRERYMHIEVDIFAFIPQYFVSIDWIEWLSAPFSRPLISLLVPEPIKLTASEASLNENSINDPFLMSEVLNSGEENAPSNQKMLAMNLVRFQDSRRVKEGELHYLDHPAFGLIASIKKLDTPDQSVFVGDNP